MGRSCQGNSEQCVLAQKTRKTKKAPWRLEVAFFFSDMIKGLHAFSCSEALSSFAGLGPLCSNTEAWGLPWWSSARGMSLIPSQGNKIPHAMCHGQIIIIILKASFKKQRNSVWLPLIEIARVSKRVKDRINQIRNLRDCISDWLSLCVIKTEGRINTIMSKVLFKWLSIPTLLTLTQSDT